MNDPRPINSPAQDAVAPHQLNQRGLTLKPQTKLVEILIELPRPERRPRLRYPGPPAAGLSGQSSQHPHRSILGRPHPGSPSTGQNRGSHSTRWHENPSEPRSTGRARSADGESDPQEDLHALPQCGLPEKTLKN